MESIFCTLKAATTKALTNGVMIEYVDGRWCQSTDTCQDCVERRGLRKVTAYTIWALKTSKGKVKSICHVIGSKHKKYMASVTSPQMLSSDNRHTPCFVHYLQAEEKSWLKALVRGNYNNRSLYS